MQLLLVGDPHVVPSELPDCWRLVDLVEQVLTTHPQARVCWLGDQHHTHGVIHLPVMQFWLQAFARLGGRDRNLALVGNHDQAGRDHVMDAYHGLCEVAYPRLELEDVALVSYQPSIEEFLSAAGAGKTLICHQSIDGSRYENGAYCHDAVKPEQIPFEQIISGHIHSPQEFGKVWYPGAPRWRTLSDARTQERAIWLVTFEGGRIVSRQPFITGQHCRPIRAGLYTPDDPLINIDAGADWRIEVRGPADYVSRRRAELAGPGRKLKSFVTDRAKIEVKESEGVERSLERFINAFTAPHGTPTVRIKTLVAQRLGIQV